MSSQIRCVCCTFQREYISLCNLPPNWPRQPARLSKVWRYLFQTILEQISWRDDEGDELGRKPEAGMRPVCVDPTIEIFQLFSLAEIKRNQMRSDCSFATQKQSVWNVLFRHAQWPSCKCKCGRVGKRTQKTRVLKCSPNFHILMNSS